MEKGSDKGEGSDIQRISMFTSNLTYDKGIEEWDKYQDRYEDVVDDCGELVDENKRKIEEVEEEGINIPPSMKHELDELTGTTNELTRVQVQVVQKMNKNIIELEEKYGGSSRVMDLPNENQNSLRRYEKMMGHFINTAKETRKELREVKREINEYIDKKRGKQTEETVKEIMPDIDFIE